jgi:hypothetical protein
MTEIGDPKEAICEAVEKLNVQLLVLGSHDRGPVQRLVFSSEMVYASFFFHVSLQKKRKKKKGYVIHFKM